MHVFYNNCSQIIFTEHCDPFIPSILRDTFANSSRGAAMSTLFSFDLKIPLAQEAVLVNASLFSMKMTGPAFPTPTPLQNCSMCWKESGNL